MSKPKILVQLDVDAHASVFDAVVAVDAGVEHILAHQGVSPAVVRELVHGAMFTRGPKDLCHTAVFVGGSNVQAAEVVFRGVTACFFGPMRVSVLFDANGANTTAAAAVLEAGRHVDLAGSTATVLGATGPVGQRAVRLLAHCGANVHVASRSRERAVGVCQEVLQRYPQATLTPFPTATPGEFAAALTGTQVLVAAGAAGVELISTDSWQALSDIRVAIDLNAVPPVGVATIDPLDANVQRDGIACYGAIGVGGLKMKIHRAAIQALFAVNDRVLDAEEVFQIGRDLIG